MNEPDIAIIGAGAAGIGAARRLAGSGRSVIILEALPRPGGRAWTHNIAGITADIGCAWLHSADRNPWTTIAEDSGFTVDRRTAAWDSQYQHLGVSAEDWAEAHQAFEAYTARLTAAPPPSDIAADALEPGNRWNPFINAMTGFISGDEPERMSARDIAAYDAASTYCNWRLPAGYGTLITSHLPPDVPLHLNTPIEAIELDGTRIALRTPAGTLHPKTVILTISTNIPAGNTIAWPAALTPWREAAAKLPLGNDEKLFLEITGANTPFAPESHVIGDPFDPATGSFYIRPFDRPVIEVFLGGAGARTMTAQGQAAAFAHATDQLANLFGAAIRNAVRPLFASSWSTTPSIGGAYSYAVPGQSAARKTLARPYENRIFFAGEATHHNDFSTAHGAYITGRRAAEEALAALAKA